MNIALILAAGKGTRLGNKIPKQFLKVDNKPIFIYTLETFNNCKEIDSILVVANKEYFPLIRENAEAYGINKFRGIIPGGETRQQSVKNGLDYISSVAKANDIILIHDSARAMVSEEIITANIEAMRKYDAVTTAIQASDTIVRSKDGKDIENTLDRSELYLVQTPQTFRFKIIKEAHEKAINDNSTDDSQLVRQLGIEVGIVPGDKNNFKITTIDDLNNFKKIIKD